MLSPFSPSEERAAALELARLRSLRDRAAERGRGGRTARARYERARNAFAERNLRLVHLLARRHALGADLDELVSAGSVGLLQAVDRFDPAHGVKFSSYAVPWIRGEILRARADSTVRHGRTLSLDTPATDESEQEIHPLASPAQGPDDQTARWLDDVRSLLRDLPTQDARLLALRFGVCT